MAPIKGKRDSCKKWNIKTNEYEPFIEIDSMVFFQEGITLLVGIGIG